MSATDELRRLLDERGAEWAEYGDGYTLLRHGGREYTVQPNVCNRLIVTNLTPEQAIAATLGQGTCHVKAAKKIGDSFGFSLSCGHSMVNPFNDHPDYCPWCGRKVVDA